MSTRASKRLLKRFGLLLADRRLWNFLLRPSTRYVAAWLMAIAAAGAVFVHAWRFYNDSQRSDGNCGHVFIDFGGQYVMGRMLVEGHARDLYNRGLQRRVIAAAYPRSDEAPPELREPKERDAHDAEALMEAFMGADDRRELTRAALGVLPLSAHGAVDAAALGHLASNLWKSDRLDQVPASRGGPLYPPVHAFLCYPLAFLPAQQAYRVAQVVYLVLAFVAGLAVWRISRGGIWWPVATTAVVLFPGYSGALNLAQNPPLTLTILLCGWALLARGRPGWGGAVWGLLVFKPVWALSFLLVPLLTGRWRTAATMVLVGAMLAALTLPAVGWHGWYDWLKVGEEAAETYKSDHNWIWLSRDILTLPRKWLDLEGPAEERRDNLAATLVGWAVFVTALEITVRLALFRQAEVRAVTGPGPAFLMLGAWITCFHFMYYDVLLAFLPIMLLFVEPGRYLELFPVAFVRLRGEQADDPAIDYNRPRLAWSYPPSLSSSALKSRNIWVLNRAVPTLVVIMLVLYAVVPLYGPPVETYSLIFLWLWCAWLIGIRWESKGPLEQAQQGAVPRMSGIDGRDGEATEVVQLQPNVVSPH